MGAGPWSSKRRYNAGTTRRNAATPAQCGRYALRLPGSHGRAGAAPPPAGVEALGRWSPFPKALLVTELRLLRRLRVRRRPAPARHARARHLRRLVARRLPAQAGARRRSRLRCLTCSGEGCGASCGRAGCPPSARPRREARKRRQGPQRACGSGCRPGGWGVSPFFSWPVLYGCSRRPRCAALTRRATPQAADGC